MAGMMDGGVLALIGAFFLLFMLVGLALYIYAALALMAIAKKTKTKEGWYAFIPILNVYLMLKIVNLPAVWLLILIAGLIPVIGGIAMMAFFIYIWWMIAEKLGKPGWWAILLIVPIVNLVIMGILAWGK
ncbi:hypothetical protein COV19_02130 [Candidatus Woesearchaeota archaeon CG10_big_fil_rev_8_21_14_0_10_44_13]|nr:MAG: hypothetical protein COV19_02130 [Candidatus Woesearchaeota archaeon CG10_big_fil_rev_8_21_14_0_10_44_13]